MHQSIPFSPDRFHLPDRLLFLAYDGESSFRKVYNLCEESPTAYLEYCIACTNGCAFIKCMKYEIVYANLELERFLISLHRIQT